MSGKWFANRGQIIQAVAGLVSASVAVVSLYFVLKTNNSLPRASAVMYVSACIFLLIVGNWIGGRRSRQRPEVPLLKTHAPTENPAPAPPAVPIHINVSPTISPTISQMVSHDAGLEKKGEAILPNVGCMKPEEMYIAHDDKSDIWAKHDLVEVEDENLFSGVVIPFCNEPQKSKKTASLAGLKARLTFHKADTVEVFRRIDSGCWLGDAYNSTRLEVGGIAYLIAVLEIPPRGLVTLANPRCSSARYSDDKTYLDYLSEGHYELKVDLMAGDQGEYSETFWFKVVAGKKATISRMDQQPMHQS